MRYEVPQFIEEETKIIGPLSIRQFFIFLGGLVVSFIFFFMFELWLWLLLTVLLFAALSILSFAKVNGRPMSALVLHAARYLWSPRLYLWQKAGLKPEEFFKEEKEKPKSELSELERIEKEKKSKTLTPEKIKDLARELDK
jgi:hypothetical protein